MKKETKKKHHEHKCEGSSLNKTCSNTISISAEICTRVTQREVEYKFDVNTIRSTLTLLDLKKKEQKKKKITHTDRICPLRLGKPVPPPYLPGPVMFT